MQNQELRTPDFYTITKVEAIAAVNAMLKAFYGCETKVTNKATKMSREKWLAIYQVVYLWRNDPLSAQVQIVEEHLRWQASF